MGYSSRRLVCLVSSCLLLASACGDGETAPAGGARSGGEATEGGSGGGSNTAPVPAADVAGTWLGLLDLPPGSIRIVINIAASPDGTWDGTLDSPDQGGFGIPISIGVTDRTVTVRAESLGLVYTGELSEDGQRLDGTLVQGTGAFPLVFDKQTGPLSYARPQDPVAPFPYQITDVAIESDTPAVTLAGTLVWPAGPGPFPAVVLVSGSGPQDRDEQLAGHRPFLVLADALARAGIASLCYDDRDVAGSTGDFATGTSADFAEDARGAVRFLASQSEFPVGSIGLIGHSEGGIIAPMVADENADVAFLVLLAGTAVDGRTILISQSRAVAAAEGVPEPLLEMQEALQQTVYACFGAPDEPLETLDRCLREALASQALSEADLTEALSSLESPWTRYFMTYDPAPLLRRTRVPVLALNGSLDLQVLASLNLPVIEAALEEAGNEDASVRELPGLNHLFQHATTGHPSEYASIEETMAPEVLAAIGDWILGLAPSGQ